MANEAKHTNEPWLRRWHLDVRGGCIAIYPEGEEHNCLSGASEWALFYWHGSWIDGQWGIRNKDLALATRTVQDHNAMSGIESPAGLREAMNKAWFHHSGHDHATNDILASITSLLPVPEAPSDA